MYTITIDRANKYRDSSSLMHEGAGSPVAIQGLRLPWRSYNRAGKPACMKRDGSRTAELLGGFPERKVWEFMMESCRLTETLPIVLFGSGEIELVAGFTCAQVDHLRFTRGFRC